MLSSRGADKITINMRKKLLSLILVFLVGITAAQAYDYDFSAVATSGQTLYYSINSSSTTVTVRKPTNYNGWSGFTTPSGNLSIPSSVTHSGTSYTVTAIGDYAFTNCTDLTSVTIPNTITTIGQYAFSSCSGITTATIGNAVTSIGNGAFSGCSNLSSLTIGSSVTTIGQYAFFGCSSLTSVTIPQSVTSIGIGAFQSCGLTTVNYNATNCTYSGVSYDTYIFANCIYLTTVNIGASANFVPYQLFRGCTGITNITFPSSAISIGEYAFYGCTGLTSLIIGDSVTSIGQYAFSNCSNLSSLTIGNAVTSIGQYAFSNCPNLLSLTIGNAVSSIGLGAFSSCTSLATVNYNATNCTNVSTAYDNYPFSGCSDFTTLNIGNNVTRIPAALFVGRPITTLTIPDSVTYIGNAAFSGCTSLNNVTIGRGVTSIVNYAFENCTSLTTLNYYADSCITMNGSYIFTGCPNFQNLNIGSNVRYIPANAFYNCRAVTSVVIPDSVTTIGANAFYGCQGLTSMTLGKRVHSILNDAFYNCSALVSTHYTGTLTQWCGIDFYNAVSNPVTLSGNLYINNQPVINLVIPDSVTTIRNYSFYGCSGLSSVTIPNTVTTIQSQPFAYCDYMTLLTLGSGLTSIGYYAFRDCTGLTSVTSLATIAPTLNSSFSGTSINNWNSPVPIYVPCGSTSSYSSRWSGYNSYYELAGPSFAVYTADSTMGNVNVLVQPSCTTQTASFVAAHLLGYRFDHWSDGVTDNPRTLTVTQDTLLAAFFVLDAIPRDTVYVYLHDTITVGEPIDYYDLSVLSVQSTGIAVGSGRFTDGTIVEIAGIPVVGNHFVQWSDGNTENPRHVTVTSDITLTALFDVDQVGVTDVPTSQSFVTVQDNIITIQGVAGQRVRIFDAVGRLLSTEPTAYETQHFRMTSAGVYLVQVGDGAAQRVVVR